MPFIAGARLMRALTMLAGSALVAASVLAVAQPAQAAVALKCGATLTKSVTLSQNVNCTANTTNDAITILKAGVTVNLNGRKLLGPGDSKDTVGIVDNGYDNVTIESGTISNFWVGADVSGGSSSEVTGLVMKDVTVTENTLSNSDTGLFGSYIHGARISGLSVSYAADGVSLNNSQHNIITDSKISGASGDGFYDSGGNANTYSHNTVMGVMGNGFESSRTTALVISFNTITGRSARGIYDNEGTKLSATGNTLSGLLYGIQDMQGSHNSFVGNKAIGDAYGLNAYNCVRDTYSRNTFDNGQFGIQDDGPAGDTLARNTTNGDSEAGIYVAAAGITGTSAYLGNNTANDNGFGLYSQFPTTGKNNHAKGNRVVNCHNVACVKL
jgi:Periplasmic copper-binding protein (NosD)